MKSKRLFFALWPNETVRAELAAVASSLPGECARIIPAVNFHITLLFLGQVADRQFESLRQQAATVQARQFHLKLDHGGWWKKPAVLWLGPSLVPAALTTLVGDLMSLEVMQLLSLDKKPFNPHVTIARKVRTAIEVPSFQPITWDGGSFSLVESVSADNGIVYQVLHKWPLH